ncbi:MAG TPA: DUF998 domain-containing protein [Chloroflexota bacterium]|jgi:phosphoglycerol transferase MdoB-like AlkP superfamily enzyme|nr:DUF998 domain-containing protein [Chloroflexota bacterium]
MSNTSDREQPRGDGVRTRSGSTARRFLLACGIVGPPLFIVAFLVEGVTRAGYNGLTQPISSLEAGPLGWMQQVNFLVFGLLIACFAVALRMALIQGIGSFWGPLLEGFVALGLVGDGIFTQDPLHTIWDVVTFTAAMGVCFVLARRFATDARWRGWATYSIATAVLMVLCLVLFGGNLRHHGDAGLFERLAVLVRSLWTVLFIARLLRGTGFSPQPEVSLPGAA